MKISIFGAGYVGLISGVCFANLGHKVICCDINQEKINQLNEGKTTIYEHDLEHLLINAIKRENIIFTTNFENAISFSNTYLACVGTPSRKDGSADLSSLFELVHQITYAIDKSFMFIIKSTVPVGTALLIEQLINEILSQREIDLPFDVVSCPEFLAQGSAIQNFMHPDRIIIGTNNDLAFEKAKELYSPLLQMDISIPILRMHRRSAELCKYASNLFLATKISFMSEISQIAQITGADISEVVKGVVADKRIGPSMSRPGCGYGGSCFPKDLKSIVEQIEGEGYHPKLLKAVGDVNDFQKQYFINKLFKFFDFNLKGKVVAIWGLAYKPNTDDLRDSVSCELIEKLLNAEAVVQAYDPMAGNNAMTKFKSFNNFKVFASKEEALAQADLLAVMTEWSEFFVLDKEMIKASMVSPVIFDGRNIYDNIALRKAGITYFAIGKPNGKNN